MYERTMQVSKDQIPALNDEDLGLIATADADTYPDEFVLAAWEELARRGRRIYRTAGDPE
jgi:hypothetical protein